MLSAAARISSIDTSAIVHTLTDRQAVGPVPPDRAQRRLVGLVVGDLDAPGGCGRPAAPNASGTGGAAKLTQGLPATASRRVYMTARFTTSECGSRPPRSCRSWVENAQSGSATMPATASCLVIAISAAVWSPSVVPVLPATGLPTTPRTSGAVAPSHWPNADWSPTGQRIASVAACAMAGSTAW